MNMKNMKNVAAAQTSATQVQTSVTQVQPSTQAQTQQKTLTNTKLQKHKISPKKLAMFAAATAIIIVVAAVVVLFSLSTTTSSITEIISFEQQIAYATGHHNQYTLMTSDGAEIPIHIPQSQTGGTAGKFGPGTQHAYGSALDSAASAFSINSRIVTHDNPDYDQVQFCSHAHKPHTWDHYDCTQGPLFPYHPFDPVQTRWINFHQTIETPTTSAPTPPPITSSPLLLVNSTSTYHPKPTVDTPVQFSVSNDVLEHMFDYSSISELGRVPTIPLNLEVRWLPYENKYTLYPKLAQPYENCGTAPDTHTVNIFNLPLVPCDVYFVNFRGTSIPINTAQTSSDPIDVAGSINVYAENDRSNLVVTKGPLEGTVPINRFYGGVEGASILEFTVRDTSENIIIDTSNIPQNKKFSLFIATDEKRQSQYEPDMVISNNGSTGIPTTAATEQYITNLASPLTWNDNMDKIFNVKLRMKTPLEHGTYTLNKFVNQNQLVRIVAFTEDNKCIHISGLPPGEQIKMPIKGQITVPADGHISYGGKSTDQKCLAHNTKVAEFSGKSFVWNQTIPKPPSQINIHAPPTPPDPATTPGGYKIPAAWWNIIRGYTNSDGTRIITDNIRTVDTTKLTAPKNDIVVDQRNHQLLAANIHPDDDVIYSAISYVKIPVASSGFDDSFDATDVYNIKNSTKYTDYVFILDATLHSLKTGDASKIKLPYLLGAYEPNSFAYVPVIPGYDYLDMTIGRALLGTVTSNNFEAIIVDTKISYEDVLGSPTIHISDTDSITNFHTEYKQASPHGVISESVRAYAIPTLHGSVKAIYDVTATGNITITNTWDVKNAIMDSPLTTSGQCAAFNGHAKSTLVQPDAYLTNKDGTFICAPITFFMEIYINGERQSAAANNTKFRQMFVANDRNVQITQDNLINTRGEHISVVAEYDFPDLSYSGVGVVRGVTPGDFVEFVITVEIAGNNVGQMTVATYCGIADGWAENNDVCTHASLTPKPHHTIVLSDERSTISGFIHIKTASIQTSQ